MAKLHANHFKRMKNAHRFFVRDEHPISGKITMRGIPHVVLIPKEAVDITITEAVLDQSEKLRGRGDSMRCPGACCVYRNQTLFPLPITGVVDFNYTTVHVQVENKSGPACLGYNLDEDWFPRMNDRKDGIKLLRERVREAGGELTLHLTPIKPMVYKGVQGKNTSTQPRRTKEDRATPRGIHLRAFMAQSGV